ncbi:gup1 [Symbiodinium necroappetens]|uniref:Gup1 protein n=1 Tax=Symbiodinium necroappetens TaxID=1628268 RepID=A0A812NHV5_9DINO|nr:gup1 [Symbiodinium necroappetens]
MARWLSAEFAVWYLVIAWAFLVKLPLAAAELAAICAEDTRCSFFLHKTRLWPQQQIDLSDIQWQESYWLLELRQIWDFPACLLAGGKELLQVCIRDQLLPQGVALLDALLHGGHTLVLATLACGSFGIAKACGASRGAPVAAWAFGLLLLAIKALEVPVPVLDPWLRGLPTAYDWHQSLHLLSLKLISFNMDYFWALQDRQELEPTQDPEAQSQGHVLSELQKREKSRPLHEYSIFNLMTYFLYSPLWLAGPTTTFNSFMSHLHDRPQQAMSAWQLLLYALRLALCLGLLEALLCCTPVWAIGRSSTYLQLHGRADLLVFLCIWRFARLWALCDGIDVPENMRRCQIRNSARIPRKPQSIGGGRGKGGGVQNGQKTLHIPHVLEKKKVMDSMICNNYSLSGFWRGWHSSFNLWLVRYLYIPLGGRRWLWANVWVVFGFVALWHDLEAKLFAWGFLNAAFMVLEHLASVVWRSKAAALPAEASRWFRAAAGALYIYVLFFVNLVGYALGISGTLGLLHLAFGDAPSTALPLLMCTGLLALSMVQVMLELRESGFSRLGKDAKCSAPWHSRHKKGGYGGYGCDSHVGEKGRVEAAIQDEIEDPRNVIGIGVKSRFAGLVALPLEAIACWMSQSFCKSDSVF